VSKRNPAAFLIRFAILLIPFLAVQPALHAQQRRATVKTSPPPDTTEPDGFFEEPHPVQQAATFADRHLGSGRAKNGVYFDFGNMIPGSGWVSGGPGYRQWFDHDRGVFDTSGVISWRGYTTAQARVELNGIHRGLVTLGSQVRWQDFPQVNIYGTGPASLDANVSEYRLKSGNVVGYATLHPFEWLDLNGDVGWLQPTIERRAGLFKRPRPDTRDLFPGDVVFARGDQPSFVHADASIVADTRDYPGHTTRGSMLRVAASQYADQDGELFTFRRYEAEAAHFVPFNNSRVVLALHGWLVGTANDAGSVVPFYLLPSLGGANTLRSYPDYRFHDRDMVVLNTELRLALMTHVDAAAFIDAGNVAARVGDLNVDKRSYGAGLRFHARRLTFARFDVARGAEGWRMVFRLNDPLSLTRIERRTAAIPFVP
jgi:surface antigen Omp85-like protein